LKYNRKIILIDRDLERER